MIIHRSIAQRSPEWFAIRAWKITASRVGAFCLEPFGIQYKIAELEIMLRSCGIQFKAKTKRDDLIALLPNPEAHYRLSDACQTLIDETLGEADDGDDVPADAWPVDDYRKCTGTRFWIERGIALEPFAIEAYEAQTGNIVSQVGFVEHDSGFFGRSPDGIIEPHNNVTFPGKLTDLEIKCHKGSVHRRMLREWKRDGKIPQEHYWQLQTSLACGFEICELYCAHPALNPVHIVVRRDEVTEQLERGLVALGKEMKRQNVQVDASSET